MILGTVSDNPVRYRVITLLKSLRIPGLKILAFFLKQFSLAKLWPKYNCHCVTFHYHRHNDDKDTRKKSFKVGLVLAPRQTELKHDSDDQ